MQRSCLCASVSMLVLVACGQATEPKRARETVRSTSQHVYGTEVQDDPNGTEPLARAVGELSTPYVECTATLVTPSRLLTAAHCVCIDTEKRTESSANQWIVSPGDVEFTISNDAGTKTATVKGARVVLHPIADALCYIGKYDDHEDDIKISMDLGKAAVDLAVIELATPISDAVTGPQPLPKVFFEPVKQAMKTGRIKNYKGTTSNTLIVGFGTNDPNAREKSKGAGVRRVGRSGDIWLWNDACDKLMFEGTCSDEYMWQGPLSGRMSGRHGDSGGPLFARLDTGEMVVVGVASGHRFDTPFAAAPDGVFMWSPTGHVGNGINNGRFLSESLGGDRDHDGVIDSDGRDNCPPSLCEGRGLPPEACANADQFDADNDGVGEVCDNCPQSLCNGPNAPNAPSYRCANPFQDNHDADKYGDTCDLCPAKNFVPQNDRDGDGVGNECDQCESPNPYITCFADWHCERDVGPGSKCGDGTDGSRKHPISGKQPPATQGFCTTVKDQDSDGVPDDCDTCATMASENLDNSNALAEERESKKPGNSSLARLGDVCDPVPIVRLPEQLESIEAAPPSPGDGKGPDEETFIEANTWVGASLSGDAPQSSLGSGQFRHCSCMSASGEERSLQDCVRDGGLCPWTTPDVNGRWKVMTAPLEPNSTFRYETNASTEAALAWKWFADANAGVVDGFGCEPTQPGPCVTYGAIFAQATTTTQYSARDSANLLRDTFRIHRTPFYRVRLPQLPPMEEPKRCTGRGECRQVFDPRRDGWISKVTTGNILRAIRDATVMQRCEDRLCRISIGGKRQDLTDLLSAGVRRLLHNREQLLWATPVEGAHRTRMREPQTFLNGKFYSVNLFGIQQAVLPRVIEADKAFAPEFVAIDVLGTLTTLEEAGYEQNFTMRDVPRTAALSQIAGGLQPGPRSDFEAVFSASERSVFVIGGVDPEGIPVEDIWRWGLDDEQWHLVAPNAVHQPSGHVLSATYDSAQSQLYVLDVKQRALGLACPDGSIRRSLTDAADTVTRAEPTECLLAGDGSDTIMTVSDSAGAIFGESGDDTVMAGPGTSLISGGPGRDTLYGWGGPDRIFGGLGTDTIFAGEGENLVIPGGDIDNASSGNGDDVFVIQAECEIGWGEQLSGGGGHDVLYTTVSEAELRLRGVTISGFEEIVPIQPGKCDAECNCVAQLPTARLYRYDAEGNSKLLKSWPYRNGSALITLSSITGGDLALTVAQNEMFQVWRLRPRDETVEFTGMYESSDHVLGKPVLDLDDLVLPVRVSGTLEFRRVTANQFTNSTEPKSL